MYVKRLLIGCLLFVNAAASDGLEGGVGVAPLPRHATPVQVTDAQITIRGEHLADLPKSASWDYVTRFTLRQSQGAPLTVTLAQPFLVRQANTHYAIPRGHIVSDGEPLLYDFRVQGPLGKWRPRAFSVPDSQPAPFGLGGAYLWDLTVGGEPLELTQRYRTGVSHTGVDQLQLVYHLETLSLWSVPKATPVTVEVWPNTPTRLCQASPGVEVHGQGAQRYYRLHAKTADHLGALRLCLETGTQYVHATLVAPALQGQLQQQLAHSSCDQVSLLRNMLYAQYGREFSEKRWQSYFAQQWWYAANPHFTARRLTREDLKVLQILAYYAQSCHR